MAVFLRVKVLVRLLGGGDEHICLLLGPWRISLLQFADFCVTALSLQRGLCYDSQAALWAKWSPPYVKNCASVKCHQHGLSWCGVAVQDQWAPIPWLAFIISMAFLHSEVWVVQSNQLGTSSCICFYCFNSVGIPSESLLNSHYMNCINCFVPG